MNKTLISTLSLAVGTLITSANIVVFSYDQAGNRVKREINAPLAQKRITGNSNSDMLESEFVTIGPNPTTGVVKVEISNFEAGDNGRISVYTTSGQHIGSVKIVSPTTEINIGSHAAGVYVVTVETDKANARSMIVKK